MAPTDRDTGRQTASLSADTGDATARQTMLARHKLVEGMIRNNEQQLRNESARGGAEIELECALRDLAASPGSAVAQRQMAVVETHLEALEDERFRLITEREWLNSSLLDFDATLENPALNAKGRA